MFGLCHGNPPNNKHRHKMSPHSILRCLLLSGLLLVACEPAPQAELSIEKAGEEAGTAAEGVTESEPVSLAITTSAEPTTAPNEREAATPAANGPSPDSPDEAAREQQARLLEQVLQVRAQQQAQGLGTGTVRVNGAWPYIGYSHLAPNPDAGIEARLVAVDITLAGHTPYFDIDDIEIVDGATLVSYGSDPHVEPLRADGALMSEEEEIPQAPLASRWLLIYAFPKDSSHFHLYYWGKQLTREPVPFGPAGLSLPYPPSE